MRTPSRKTGRKITRRKNVSRSSIPAAYGMTTQSYARLSSRRDGSTTLESFEIFPVTSQSAGLSYMLPMTPTKWIGTRTQTLASSFTQSRPLAIEIGWEPAVGTSTAGSVALGTVWSGARLPSESDSWSSISRSLAATNGGFITTLWKHMRRTVDCARNLRANGFPMYEVQPDDIPFWILVASTDTTDTVIGYLTVKSVITLRNPICGSISPPISGAGKMEFTHDAEANTTTMSVNKNYINSEISVGQDILFTFGRNLLNNVPAVLTQILSTVRGSLKAIVGNNYMFNVDSNYATQQALGYIVGRSANF